MAGIFDDDIFSSVLGEDWVCAFALQIIRVLTPLLKDLNYARRSGAEINLSDDYEVTMQVETSCLVRLAELVKEFSDRSGQKWGELYGEIEVMEDMAHSRRAETLRKAEAWRNVPDSDRSLLIKILSSVLSMYGEQCDDCGYALNETNGLKVARDVAIELLEDAPHQIIWHSDRFSNTSDDEGDE